MPFKPTRLACHFAVTAVVTACLALSMQDANALALGRVAVQSALGEPLRAEIEVPDINPDEAASLRVGVGSADALRRAGMEYNPLLSGVQVTLQRRPDGRTYLRLSSDRVVNDPYLDLIIEATWSAGRLTRDYTMLFDPPSTARQTTPAPIAPAVPAPPSSTVAAPSQVEAAPRPAPASPAMAPTVRQTASAPRIVRAAPPPPAPKEPVASREGQQVTVRAGDTASKIATATKPPSISLDQMLVALLQSNPDAFTGGNVNRLKAGAVLNVPTAERAAAIPAPEASQIVMAQSRDFNDFRRKLAAGALTARADTPSREASGKVQATVEDKKPASASPDRLSLQKGDIASKANQEKIARDLEAREAEKRLAELNKNISDLNKLAAAPAPAASVPATTKTPGPVPPASAPGLPVAAAPVVPPASVPAPAASAPEPVVPASAPAAAASTPPAVKPPAPAASKPAPPTPPEPDSLVDELLANPLIPAAAAGLVALLAGLGVYRVRQRRKANQVDSSFVESRLQPDSFFGASGGQKIDTNEALASGSSMMYSPSQLDAGADVDPVAEADVYLAYGRDLQAEEILKEALRSNPGRAAIHFKLLQIYAKRRDVKAYAVTAADAYKLTSGLGGDWAQACETGRELDPTNPLYQGEGMAGLEPVEPQAGFPSLDADLSFPEAETPETGAPSTAAPSAVDLDLDLDFSAAPMEEVAAAPASMSFDMPASPSEMPQLPDLALDLPAPPDLDLQQALPELPSLDFEPTPPPPAAPEAPAEPAEADNALDFTVADLELPPDTPAALAPAPVEAQDSSAMLEFDLDSISLDLDGDKPAADQAVDALTEEEFEGLDGEDPLVTKLALAEEFHAIGDDDGARTLAQEVADTATGNLKTKAQRFLSELS